MCYVFSETAKPKKAPKGTRVKLPSKKWTTVLKLGDKTYQFSLDNQVLTATALSSGDDNTTSPPSAGQVQAQLPKTLGITTPQNSEVNTPVDFKERMEGMQEILLKETRGKRQAEQQLVFEQQRQKEQAKLIEKKDFLIGNLHMEIGEMKRELRANKQVIYIYIFIKVLINLNFSQFLLCFRPR